jgi:predicted DsbA family dithiol-disulfide isomerase
MGGTEEGALQAEVGLKQLGSQAGINFRFDQKTNWQPVDSQRLLLWASRFSKQEEFMSVSIPAVIDPPTL